MRFLTCLIAVPILVALESAALAQVPRFFADDPLLQEPAPLPVSGIEARALSAVLETVNSSFKTRGERHPDTGIIPGAGSTRWAR